MGWHPLLRYVGSSSNISFPRAPAILIRSTSDPVPSEQGYPNGTFSNGRVYPSYMAERLGLPLVDFGKLSSLLCLLLSAPSIIQLSWLVLTFPYTSLLPLFLSSFFLPAIGGATTFDIPGNDLKVLNYFTNVTSPILSTVDQINAYVNVTAGSTTDIASALHIVFSYVLACLPIRLGCNCTFFGTRH